MALFPLIFNLSIAQELEVSTEETEKFSQTSPDHSLSREEQNISSFPLDKEDKDLSEGIWEINDKIEESLQPQEDETIKDSLLRSEWQDDTEQPLSPQQAEQASDSFPYREQNFQQLFSPRWEGVPDLSGEGVDNKTLMDSLLQSPQNDENAQEDEDSDEELQPELIISEVYYDGLDEWIEIYNIWNEDFSWDIVLSWATSKNQTYTNIQIPADDFLIIADSDVMFNFSWNVNILLNTWNYKQFSIADTKAIQISLLFSWEELDCFYVHENRVKDWNDEKMSFQKVISKWNLVVTWSYFSDDEEFDRQNIIPWYIATPWILIETTEKVKDMSVYIEEPEEEELMDCWDVYQSPVTVSEVFRWWSRYNPYIEFDIHDDLEWYDFEYLELTWSLIKTWIFIDVLEEDDMNFDIEDLEKNTKLILTTTAWDLTEAGLITIVLQPDFELNLSGWELQLYGISRQNRQLLDIVKIGSWILEKSVYRPNSIHTCGEIMDNVMDFSPGFNESALKYFSVTSSFNVKTVETVKYVWWGGGCSCQSKEQLCGKENENVVQTWNAQKPPFDKGGAEWNEAEGLNTWDTQEIPPTPLTEGGQENPQWTQIKIVSLEPKSPESITVQSFLPYDIDFKNHNYYLKTSTSNTKKYLEGIIYTNTIDTFTKNFWFVDAWACVYLYSWDIQLDSYCYSSQKTEKESKEEKSDDFNPSVYQISITDINYDPDWSDSWNETITIESKSSQPLDLSKIKMKVNATNKKISGILEPYSSITLKWSFGFPNSTKDGSDVVVILFYDNHIFSTYTYNPNKPKIEIPNGAVKVYSVIDGDTFRYRKEDWNLQSVRLLGVDAPESNTARYRTTECFWKEAKNYLTNLIKNQYVTLEYDPNSATSDAYGRMLAYVYLDWKLVNETLITEWYAKEYTYKTAYSQQSTFKHAEENAKKSEKWLWSSSICGKSIEEEPEAWWIDYEKLSIKISNVIYDPDGTDSWNEIVQLSVDNSQISTVSSIDFSDDFSLTIFPRSEYSTWTTKNKKLSEFWVFDLSSSSQITLKWNFWLPNNRATCVSLNQWNYTFDTRCYNPNWPLSDEETEIQTWNLAILPNVKIQSIVPNPSGKDSWKEEITLLRTPSDDFPESQTTLDLRGDFSLLINGKTKKKLVWSLISNQSITIKWSFSLPNTASCISLLYKWEELDKFCYWKASDGVKFNSNNTSVSEIPAEELAIIKKIKLVRQWDKLCISYNKTQFSCKKIPNSTTEKNKKLLSMQNSYIKEVENYLKTNYSMLYYNSELKEYFELYSSAKKAIKSWNYSIYIKWKEIVIWNISSLFDKKYEKDVQTYFIDRISNLLPDIINEKLSKLSGKYIQEKSELGWLWQ